MKCELCGTDRQNSLLYGEFLTKNGKGVHTYCLYLSSGLKQTGKDNEGILGFLLSDIAAERKRVSAIQCCYCGKMHANIGCCEVKCYRNFHLICGIDRGAMNQFLCTFRSFCDRHVRKIQTRPKPSENCSICYESLFEESKRFRAVKMIRSPCCKNGWFHKYCLQKFARSSGYFFKCPLCNDCEKFKAHMSFWGIFVYDKDAEWELVPNAFAELLERPRVCGAEICHNKGGRGQHNATKNPFIYCTTCGSVAIHRNCVPQRGSAFDCENCKQILLNADSGRESLGSQQPNDSQVNLSLQNIVENESVDIDVCGSDNEDETNNKFQDEDDAASEEDNKRILRMKHETVLQIMDDVEESANEDEECIGLITKRGCKASSSNLQANFDTAGTDTDTVEERNARNGSVNAAKNIYKTISSCSKTKQLNCSATDSDFSGDEGIVDTFERKLETSNFRLPDTDGRVRRTIISPTSCIAQRTRRKSMAFRPPSLEEPVSNSSADVYDDASSNASLYQPPKGYHVFQYDDDDDDENDDDENDDVTEYGSTEQTENEQEENMQNQSMSDYTTESEDESESLHVNKHKPQTNQSIEHQKDSQENNSNRATNPLDISCIANRTRRRSSFKIIKSASMQSPCHNSVVDIKDETIMPTTSQQATNKNDAFIYEEGCEYIEIERGTKCTPLVEELKSKEDGQLMDYFFHLLSEVKNANANNAKKTDKSRENVKKRNNILRDPLKTSCIASRTRRRSIYTNTINNLNKEQTKFDSSPNMYQKSTSPTAADISNNSVANDWKSINSSSTNESFKSSTYFGKTIKTENIANVGSERDIYEINDYNHRKQVETSTSKEIERVAQKRKYVDDTNMPTKKSVVFAENTLTTNALTLNCIANRTRRKSVDKNKFTQICEQPEQTSTVNACTTSTPQTFTSIITISLIDSSPENSCSNIICLDTPTKDSAMTPTTSIETASANMKRDERLRARSRRFLNIYDEHDYAKPSFAHSPTDSMSHWSNLKEKGDPYVMPRYVRVNGKLRRVSTETVLQQQQQIDITLDSQTHFARSYNLLLHATKDNRRKSTNTHA